MTALTLLSVVAPAAPNVPQGSSSDVASDFQDLLAALSDPGRGVGDAKNEGSGSPKADLEKIDASTAAGVLTPPPATPTPLPVLMALSTGGEETAEAPLDGSAPDSASAPTAAVAPDADVAWVSPLAPQTTGVAESASKDSRQVQTWPLAPSTPGEKPVSPQVQPRLPDTPAIEQPTGDTPDLQAKTGATTDVAEAVARLPAAPPPPSAPPAAPTPAPLRPLAERGSRPVDPLTGAAADETVLTGPRPNAAVAGPSAAPGFADAPAPSIDRTPVAVVAGAVDSADMDAPTSDLPPIEEGAASQTAGAAPTRDAPASQLSRATIEATAQIAAQILRRLEGRSTRFEMALTPDELGRVDVRLDIDSEGRLNARLAFDNPAAATDLRGRADELRRELQDAGFHLADDAFEFADRDSNSSAFDRGQDGRNGQSRAFAAASRLNAEIDLAQPPAWLALSLSPSGVDMKV